MPATLSGRGRGPVRNALTVFASHGLDAVEVIYGQRWFYGTAALADRSLGGHTARA